MRLNKFLCVGAALAMGSAALGENYTNQQPGGGSVARWSQLWQDPGPNGNDLDSDAICWEDFVLSAPGSINHIEWWGAGACELGFRIEVWRQDPGTVAYQPLAVFDAQGGGGQVQPEARFVVTPTDYATSPGPNGTTHFSLELATPIVLPANDAANPRWFIGIIAYTRQYTSWNWSQGIGGSNRTFQWQRADGGRFFSLPEGRALVLANNACVGAAIGLQPVSVSTCLHGTAFFDIDASGSGAMGYQWWKGSVELIDEPGHIEGAMTPNLVVINATTADIGQYTCVATNECGSSTSDAATLGLLPDFNGDGLVNGADLSVLLANFGASHPGVAGDANGDDVVNGADLSVLIGTFGSVCQ